MEKRELSPSCRKLREVTRIVLYLVLHDILHFFFCFWLQVSRPVYFISTVLNFEYLITGIYIGSSANQYE